MMRTRNKCSAHSCICAACLQRNFVLGESQCSWYSSYVSDVPGDIDARSNWTVGLDYICTYMRSTSRKTLLPQRIDEGTERGRVNFCSSRNLINSYISRRQPRVTLFNHHAKKFFQSDTIFNCACPSPFVGQA